MCSAVFALLGAVFVASRLPAAEPSAEIYGHVAAEVEANLQHDVLDKWFPAAVDKRDGGFFEDFAEDWSRGDGSERSIVYQSRLTWLSAHAALRDPSRAETYLAITRHGAAFLADKQWDHDRGGFFWAVDVGGHPTKPFGGEKHAYGVAFGIYAAAGSYEATHDAATLDLAKRAFRWLDDHAHDSRNGGYFEALTADGSPILAAAARPTDAIGTRYGFKSMNTHIHLLEAFTGLYAVWPDPAVRARLQELFEIVHDKIYVDPGCQHLYFSADWRPVPDLDSFGHDIETAYLMTEAAAALGKRDDAATWTAARRLVDHALEYGFDRERGGFYNEGTTFGRDLVKDKIWWVQAEGLNALLVMHEHFGRETPRYWEAFSKQWEFISHHQIDTKHGGWYSSVASDGTAAANRAKSDRWTEGYHQGRALMNVSAALHRLAEVKTSQDARDLQGEWQAVENQERGRSRSERETGTLKNRRWIFQGNELIEFNFVWSQELGPQDSKRRFTLDPSKSPKQIDIAITWLDKNRKDQMFRSIYSLDRDRLTICERIDDKRPTDFKSSKENGNYITVYERVGADPTATLEFAKISSDFGRMYRAWFDAQQKAKTTAERRKVAAEIASNRQLIAERYLKFAVAHPNGFAELAALCWAAFNAPASEPGAKAIAVLKAGRVARADLNELNRSFEIAGTPFSDTPESLAPQVLVSVKRQLSHPEAAKLLTWVCVSQTGDESTEASAAYTEAADLIVSRFAGSPDIVNFCESLGMGHGSPLWAGRFEKHLRAILNANQDRAVRAAASFALASVVQGTDESRQIEAEKLYEEFIKKFDGSESYPCAEIEKELNDSARRELAELKSRGMGKPAPEIDGVDLNGHAMRLSEFRGKVVLLSFWATWCGPCMRMVPREKSLAERLQDKPFALIGVNGDNEPEELKKGIEKFGITWRSFKDKQGTKKAISDEWNTAGWPTLYLIDPNGIIRKRWVSTVPPEVLDREIDHLIELAISNPPDKR